MVGFAETWTDIIAILVANKTAIAEDICDTAITVEAGTWKVDFTKKNKENKMEMNIDTPASPFIVVSAMPNTNLLSENRPRATIGFDLIIGLESQEDSVVAVKNMVMLKDRIYKILRKNISQIYDYSFFLLSTFSDSPRIVISFNLSYIEGK